MIDKKLAQFCDSNQPPWFNLDIRHHIKCIHTLRCKQKGHLTACQPQTFSIAESKHGCRLVSEFANNNNSKI